jgi:hypothetical protein
MDTREGQRLFLTNLRKAMNTVSWTFRNLINPWQTESEIKAQERVLIKLYHKLLEYYGPVTTERIFRTKGPEKDWT